MRTVARAVMRNGEVELLDDVTFPEGARLVVTVVPDHSDVERAYWMAAVESALNDVWGNADDDVYAELLAPEEREALRQPQRAEPEGAG